MRLTWSESQVPFLSARAAQAPYEVISYAVIEHGSWLGQVSNRRGSLCREPTGARGALPLRCILRMSLGGANVVSSPTGGVETMTFARGDWVTLTDPYFLGGTRAMVVEVHIKLMTVAYLDSGGGVETRKVPITSAKSGHDGRGRGLEAVNTAIHEFKIETAKEIADFAVSHNLIEAAKAAEIEDAYAAELSGEWEQVLSARIEAEREVLSEWLASR